jgi:hypothetical protein
MKSYTQVIKRFVKHKEGLNAPGLAFVAYEVSSTENPEVRLDTNTTGK